ncbi:MAG TPA: rhomboid family intramembrane serine protease, partial [Candidatus Nanopelagicales bacterium]|nr:rhomboid family intramembrane serine protease [Candidatus Nanopelagicales bacterium]
MQGTLARLLPSSVPAVLIASVVLVSLAGWLYQPMQRALILQPYRVKQGQVHRLLTAGWVHADVSHLAFNMFTLYIFAGRA